MERSDTAGRGELRLVYQPIVDIARCEATGFAVLVRREDPDGGAVVEGRVTPEGDDAAGPVAGWTVHGACAQAARWATESADGPPFGVAVKVPDPQVASGGAVGIVEDALGDTGLAPGLLSLELTQRALAHDLRHTLALVARLRDLGVRLVVDECTTLHPSRGPVAQLAVHGLKIDRSLVAHLGTTPDDDARVGAIVRVAHASGMTVAAEGVETPRQLSELRSLGCDFGQGDYFARPQPSEVASALVHRRFRWRHRDPAT